MILTYHEVTEAASRYRYSVTRASLDAHLGVVARFQDPHGLADAASSLVTFDDGERSNYLHAPDLLEKHGVRATFFVIAGWIGAMKGFMSWPELSELASAGHRVQSHGWSHRPLTDCSESELRDELQRSRSVLEDRLGIAVEELSIPFGRCNDSVLRACSAAGYRRVYLSDPWLTPHERGGLRVVGRYMVPRSLTPRQVRGLLAGDPAYLFFLRFRYRLKESLRSMIGHGTYHRLWLRVAGTEDVATPKVLE